MRRGLTAPPGGRFTIEIDEHGQRAVLPLKNDWRHAALSIAGAAGLAGLHTRELWGHPTGGFRDYVLASVLVLALLAVAIELTFTFFGRETVAVRDGRIIHRWSALGLRRSRTLDLAAIETVIIAARMEGPGDNEISANAPVSPMSHFGKRGRIKIDFSDTSTYLGAALDEDGARALIQWLRPWLPRRVVTGEERARYR